MLRLLQISLIFLASYSLEVYSEEACGIEFQRDCDEKDTYLLIDQSFEAYNAGDLLLYQKLREKIKLRCEESISEHLKLVCRGNMFNDRSTETEEDIKKLIQDIKVFISDFQKLKYFHTDFLFFYEFLLDYYPSYDEDLYDYLKESIELSRPKETNNKNKEYLYALAQWQNFYTRIIQEVEEDEELVLKSYAKTLDLFAKSRGNKSEIYLGTKLNLAYYYFAYYGVDLSYLTKAYKSCQEILLESDLEDSIDVHLRCWLLLDDIEYEKDSGNNQKGFYYRIFLENYLKSISEYNFFDISLDQEFLNSFPVYFGDLDCPERRKAWNIYQDLWEVRWGKYTGVGELDNKRKDYEEIWADITITTDALWCQEEGVNEEFTKELIDDLQTVIQESLNVDIKESDVMLLQFILDAVELLYWHIPESEYQNLKSKLYMKMLDEVNWYEKEITEYGAFASSLLYVLVEFLNYESADKELLLQKIDWLKELFIDYKEGSGMNTDEIVIFDVFTRGLYAEGLQEIALNNYKDMFDLLPLNMSINLDPFLGDRYHANSRLAMNSLAIKANNSKLAYKNLFQNLKYLDRGPLELSIITSKLSDGLGKKALDDYLKAERLKSRFINEYSEDQLSDDFYYRSQEVILNSIKVFNELNNAQKLELYSFLYPEVSIEIIRSKLKDDETLILLYKFSLFSAELGPQDYLTSIAVNKNEEVIEIKDISLIEDMSLDEFISSLEKDLKQSLFNRNQNYLGKIDTLSKLLIPNISLRDNIIFISNLNEFISPSLLRKENKWLIESKEIRVNFSVVDFLTDDNTYINFPSNYIGIGDVDYSGYEDIYHSLPNTNIELQNSSREFPNKRIYLGKEANEENLKNTDLRNSLVHFATHTNKSIDSNFQLPSIVLAKSELEDGYLDVFEISELNFNNSHIVLAACDTDSSIYEDTDQFSGFVKSFQISGAKSILATRWEIETNSAQTVTQSYIKKIKNQLNPQKALAETQRELINLNYHPFFWSGYFVIE